MASDDLNLIARLQRGERAAFEKVVAEQYASVWRQQYLLCGDSDLAADLTQETFLEAWRGIGRFQGRSSLRTWLYTIAARIWYRRGLARDARGTCPLPETLLWDGPQTEAEALKHVEMETVMEAISRLPGDLRVVLVLHYRQELSHSEIATALGIPPGTVKTRIYEGLRRLRTMLQAPGRENP